MNAVADPPAGEEGQAVISQPPVNGPPPAQGTRLAARVQQLPLRAQLFHILMQSFAIHELKQAAFVLQLDNELEGITLKDEFARGLIIKLEHRERLGELIVWVQGERPSLNLNANALKIEKVSRPPSAVAWGPLLLVALFWFVAWRLSNAIAHPDVSGNPTWFVLAVAGAVGGGLGGLVTGLMLQRDRALLRDRDVYIVTLSWMVGLALGWAGYSFLPLFFNNLSVGANRSLDYFVLLIAGVIGGLVSALTVRRIASPVELGQIWLSCLGWVLGATICRGITEALPSATVNTWQNFIWPWAWAIGGAISYFALSARGYQWLSSGQTTGASDMQITSPSDTKS